MGKSSYPREIGIDDIEGLSEALEKLSKIAEISIEDYLAFGSEGLEEKTTPEGIIRITLKVDKSTITFNENRELTLAPEFIQKIMDGRTDISPENNYGYNCNQTITLEDITQLEGFQEWIASQIKEIVDL